MKRLPLWILLACALPGARAGAQEKATPPAAAGPIRTAVQPETGWSEPVVADCACDQPRGRFRSDNAFPHFVGPISNLVFAKDPRAQTYARFTYLYNDLPGTHALGGGDLHAVALQLNVALTDRLTFIADKDGYAFLRTPVTGSRDGFLNIGLGFKYALIRDVENQFLFTVGAMYEPRTGSQDVFSGHGDGTVAVFGTVGKEFGCRNHALFNFGYQVPMNTNDNSSYVYTQLHLDRQIGGWFYPLVEVNWFHWVQGGNRGLPAALGEGDGLINLGTSGVAGNDWVTVAVGAQMRLRENFDLGLAWEFPISNRQDLLENRFFVQMVLRY